MGSVFEVMNLLLIAVGPVVAVMNLLPKHRLRRALDLDTQIAQRLPEGPARDELQAMIDKRVTQLTRPPGKKGIWIAFALIVVGAYLGVQAPWYLSVLGIFYIVLGASALGLELLDWFLSRQQHTTPTSSATTFVRDGG